MPKLKSAIFKFFLIVFISLFSSCSCSSKRLDLINIDEEVSFYLLDQGISNSSATPCFSISEPCVDMQQIITFIGEELDFSSSRIINIMIVGVLMRCEYAFTNVDRKFKTIQFRSANGDSQSVIGCPESFVQLSGHNQLVLEQLIVRRAKMFIMQGMVSVKFVDLRIEESYIQSNGKSTVFTNCTVIGGYTQFSTCNNLLVERVSVDGGSFRFNGIDSVQIVGNNFQNSQIQTRSSGIKFQQNNFVNSGIVILEGKLELSDISFKMTSVQITLILLAQLSRFQSENSTISVTGVDNIQIQDATFKIHSQLILSTVIGGHLQKINFEENENALALHKVGDVYIMECNFTRNMNPVFISGEAAFRYTKHIQQCTFNDNWSMSNAIIQVQNAEVTITGSFFRNNWGVNGGAIYASDSRIYVSQSTFENTHARSTVLCGVSECGNGGIAFISNSVFDFTSLEIYNVGAIKGAIVYTKGNSQIVNSFTSVISDNYASISGNLFYFNDLADFTKGNYSKHDLGSRKISKVLWRIDPNQPFSNSRISLYPGENVVLSYVYFDEFLNLYNRTSVPPVIKSKDSGSLVSISSIDPNSNTVTSLLLQVSENVKDLNISVYIPYHEFNFEIGVDILDCPYDYGYSQLSSPNLSVCVYKGFTVIIFSSISLCIVILIAGYLLIYVGKRLFRLYKKEKSEKDIEKKILDKQFVFSVNHEEKSPLLRSDAKLSNASNILIPIEDIEIIRKIGEGANGTVYLANWNGTRVALKSLKFDRDSDEFEHEASLLNSLKHPSIVRFFGIVVSSSTKYMVTEFLTNGSLDSAIHYSKIGKKKLGLEKKIDILKGIASGMNYLHNLRPRALIHRDLKCANILLNSDLESKVTDFGLSRLTNNGSTMTCNIGTILNMAPELMGSGFEISHKLDIYSFSIIMYELFFEESPYFSSSEKIRKNVDIKPEDPLNGFCIPAKVSKGERPVIPWTNEREFGIWIQEFIQPLERNSLETSLQVSLQYVNLMKECWNQNPAQRPNFSQIVETLLDMLEKFQ